MRLKLDENMPRPLAEAMRRVGHDVHAAADEDLLGKPDDIVWSAAVRENRLLMTLDRDFGRLAIASGGHSGAVVLRPRDANQATITTLAHRAIALVADRPPLAIVISEG